AGQNGPSGYLQETGNCYSGNDVPGQVEFSGATHVAGNAGWSNYVVAARILPSDDDSHGILLRYLDPEIFYCIELRSVSTTNGPPRGLSIQKNVNRIYSEV